MASRRGSIIIYCIGLAAILVVVGYGFLRGTLADSTAGDASHKVLLAQSAARMAVMRATEAILSDYAQTTMALNQGTGGGSVTVNGTTYLDGNWRSPFVSFANPNALYNVDRNDPLEQDDVSAENMVNYPMIMWASGDESTRRHAWHDRAGTMIYDGRGRYTEAGYHPVTRPGPAGTASMPIPVHRFTDFAAPVPERNEGLFLDRDFRRIDTGNPQQDRLLARYRLRYGMGVQDLSGHLLMNPYAEGNFDPRSATADFRNPPAWIASNQHSWYNLVLAMGGNDITTALRFEHMFLGRGNASNVDRHPASGLPITFPLMFRHRQMEGAAQPYWGFYVQSRGSGATEAETDGLYLPASAGGGEPIPAVSRNNRPIVSHGFGPQISWFNQYYDAAGWFGKWEGDTGWASGTMDFETVQFVPTPFGRGLRRSTAPPANWKWYEGRVDTPWHVNLLTASPRVIHSMLVAYLPPDVKSLLLDLETFHLYTGLDARGHDTWGNALVTNTAVPGTPAMMRGRDVFTSFSSPAFSYAPPSADGITPNYQKPDGRGIEAKYPGRLWYSVNISGQLGDDLGKDIDVDARPGGACSHIREPFFYGFSSERTLLKSQGSGWTTTPPAGWGTARTLPTGALTDGSKDKVVIKHDSGTVKRYTFEHSYWWDLVVAYTTSIATVRAAWVQFPTSALNPYTGMDAALHDPSAFDTLEEVDRLFLRQLGEDFDNPGSGSKLPHVVYPGPYNNNNQTYRITGATPSHTIRTLVTGGFRTIDQANAMERVLNDMRMSFFGAGPGYSETFRPKDFSGDGKVHCSAYARNPAASLTDEENGVAWWQPAAGGDGPVVDHWFSLSGCFFIGKSHYFRVFSRGEVWDNLLQKTVVDQTLETVLCVDPEGTDPGDAKVLYQRWHFSRSTSHLPRQVD